MWCKGTLCKCFGQVDVCPGWSSASSGAQSTAHVRVVCDGAMDLRGLYDMSEISVAGFRQTAELDGAIQGGEYVDLGTTGGVQICLEVD